MNNWDNCTMSVKCWKLKPRRSSASNGSARTSITAMVLKIATRLGAEESHDPSLPASVHSSIQESIRTGPILSPEWPLDGTTSLAYSSARRAMSLVSKTYRSSLRAAAAIVLANSILTTANSMPLVTRTISQVLVKARPTVWWSLRKNKLRLVLSSLQLR